MGLLLLGGPSLRAQVTESPTTVAPGHFLLRIDAVSFKSEDSTSLAPGTRFDAVALGTTYLTAGLTTRSDIQLGAELFIREKIKAGPDFETHSGAGSFYVRPKWTFWIDPSTQVLAAIMPWIKLPTGAAAISRRHVEGGVILPWEMFLHSGWRADAMAEWDVIRNDDDTGYDSKWGAAANVQHDLGPHGNIYFESSLALNSAGLDRSALNIGAGLTFQLCPLLQADAAIYRGLSSAASDWNPVLRLRSSW